MIILIVIAVVDIILLGLVAFSARRRQRPSRIWDARRPNDWPHAL